MTLNGIDLLGYQRARRQTDIRVIVGSGIVSSGNTLTVSLHRVVRLVFLVNRIK
jgi:hypothetical protein